MSQNAVDVSDTVKKGEDSRLVDPDAVIAEEERHEAELAALAARRPPRRPQGIIWVFRPSSKIKQTNNILFIT